jgi:KDO2-lipid IV(A) lauroyltransferase
VALRNVALCLPELDAAARRALVREHFGWLARSILERSILWYASPARLRRLIRIEGDVKLAERSPRAVMWIVPHFLAVDVAGAATQLYQQHAAFDVYAPQSNKVLDEALLRGRSRFGTAEFFKRQDGARPIVRAIKRGSAFFNPCDMDFGLRDAAFVPFFGHPAATLLAPSRMARGLDMIVQPVVAEILPGGQGWCVRFLPPWTDWPTDDPVADAARMNRFIEEQIRLLPAQYLWVHKRFKTRPEGAPPVYD